MSAALLDTNGVSDLMRDHPRVKARIATHPHPIATSVVAVGEIWYGLNRLPHGKKRTDLEARANNILGALRIEPVTEQTANTYGRLKASLESQEWKGSSSTAATREGSDEARARRKAEA